MPACLPAGLQAARQVNESLLLRCGAGRGSTDGKASGDATAASPPAPSRSVDTASLLGAVRVRLEGEQEVTKLEALRWVHALMASGSREVSGLFLGGGVRVCMCVE